MKKLSTIILFLLLIPSVAGAVIGLGIKGGFAKDAKNDTYGQSMTHLGVDARISALPKVDLIGSIEYSWKKYKVSDLIPVEGTTHFVAITGSVVVPFKMPVISPYAGLGYGFHAVGGTIDLIGAGEPASNGTGFHFLAGIKVGPPASPLSVYGEYRHYWTNFDDGNGRYYTLAVGIMFGAI